MREWSESGIMLAGGFELIANRECPLNCIQPRLFGDIRFSVLGTWQLPENQGTYSVQTQLFGHSRLFEQQLVDF